MRTPRLLTALPALALSALLLSGCAAAATSESGSDSGGMPGFEEGVGAPVTDEAAGDGDLESQPGDEDRAVITTGYLYLTVDAPLDAATEAVSIVEAAGGRVDGRTEYGPQSLSSRMATDAGGAELVLRIPAERLTATIEKLKALGEVEELQVSSSDVTREVQDIDARVVALRSSITRLLALQDAAATVEDLIALETAISDRQAQLESYEAQQRYYADQVGLSTLTLTLGSLAIAPIDEPDTFLSGLVTGWEALVAFGSGLLVVVGVLLPWLLALGLIGLVVLLIVRGVVRRGSSRAATSPEAAAPVATDTDHS
ncbi:DUF4349 domain-containing protein [Microcella humidisoli]|uniref:DUF4349 domain-containing protein n=1 Tax=Microcella humidisoli TaxID=2963406 RepID=A0ABY5FUP2_9MICO|nr:DUF4349 domain-containing protein [Microcella humidisoli]UTT61610.1 DUF4349 domain-containing protein [Microcella humidisoli]